MGLNFDAYPGFQLKLTHAKGPFIYYVITFLGFLDPPPPLRNHVFSTENNQKLAFSDPPPPYKYYAIYEWSPTNMSTTVDLEKHTMF